MEPASIAIKHPRTGRGATKPLAVAVIVLALYGAWIGAYSASGHDVRDFIRIGTRFVSQGNAQGGDIRLPAGYHPPANQNGSEQGHGYDGQFTYYLAADPSKARLYMDAPSYRYSRILEPLLVRLVTLGRQSAIPWAMLVIGWLSIGAGTWGIGIWLRRRGLTARWALLYGLWPGLLIGVQRDLTEPLGYALVIGGVLLLDGDSDWAVRRAGGLFALAGLARQTTLVFPVVYGCWLLLGGEVSQCARGRSRAVATRHGAELLVLSVAPFLGYSIFLRIWLGSWDTGGQLSPIPFGGVLHAPLRASYQGVDLLFAAIPAMLALWVLLPAWPVRSHSPRWLSWFLVLANLLVNFVFFGEFYQSSYTSTGRLFIGVLLAFLLGLPAMVGLSVVRRRVLIVCCALAFVMLPVVAIYGFTNISA